MTLWFRTRGRWIKSKFSWAAPFYSRPSRVGLVDHKQMPICQGKMLLDHVAKEGRSYAGGQDTLLRKEDTYTGSQNDLLRCCRQAKNHFLQVGAHPHPYPTLTHPSTQSLQRIIFPLNFRLLGLWSSPKPISPATSYFPFTYYSPTLLHVFL